MADRDAYRPGGYVVLRPEWRNSHLTGITASETHYVFRVEGVSELDLFVSRDPRTPTYAVLFDWVTPLPDAALTAPTREEADRG